MKTMARCLALALALALAAPLLMGAAKGEEPEEWRQGIGGVHNKQNDKTFALPGGEKVVAVTAEHGVKERSGADSSKAHFLYSFTTTGRVKCTPQRAGKGTITLKGEKGGSRVIRYDFERVEKKVSGVDDEEMSFVIELKALEREEA